MGPGGRTRGVLRALQLSVALYDGKVFVASIDAYLKAARCENGKPNLEDQSRRMEGRLLNHLGAPVVNGVLITGMTGGEYGVRGSWRDTIPRRAAQLWRRVHHGGSR